MVTFHILSYSIILREIFTNDCAIFIHNADPLAVSVPTHSSHHGLVPVVDHLLVPRALDRNKVIEIEIYGLCRTYLVQHPYYDQSILIRRCQFLVRLVPCYHLDLPLVTLKSLIH